MKIAEVAEQRRNAKFDFDVRNKIEWKIIASSVETASRVPWEKNTHRGLGHSTIACHWGLERRQ